MKILIAFLLFAISLHATGQEKPVSMDMVISEPIKKLSINICWEYTRDATKVAKNIKEILVDFLIAKKKAENPNQKQVPPPSPEEIIKFLNKHKNEMLCGNTNYMVESFKHGAYDELFNIFFYEELLVEDEDLYVDINAISYTGSVTENEPETVLDYMYREVKRESRSKKSRGEIQDLIDFFVSDLGGKRFAELTDEEQAAAQGQKPN